MSDEVRLPADISERIHALWESQHNDPHVHVRALDIEELIDLAWAVQEAERRRCVEAARFEICSPGLCMHECCRTARSILKAIEQP